MNNQRVAIFIDGSNLYHGLKSMKIKKIDFQDLINELVGNNKLKKVFYYTARMDKDFDEKRYAKHQNFLKKLSFIPNFKISYCTFKKIIEKNGKVSYAVKGDDVQLANDMIVGAYENHYDIAILVSGDEDFKPVVRTVRKRGKIVENIFFRGGSSSRLRKTCNSSKNIRFILEKINRRPGITE
ncbi:MAG: NYN domain-containing protein [Candidatus Pacearchaeota archaeon]|jgi:uncharacterized LabA/DUF88 family protein